MSVLNITALRWARPDKLELDWTLLLVAIGLASFGVIMVASASIDFAAQVYGDPWFFVKRHLVFLLLAIICSFLVYSLPVEMWNRIAILLLLGGVGLLIAVLIPGVGKRLTEHSAGSP